MSYIFGNNELSPLLTDELSKYITLKVITREISPNKNKTDDDEDMPNVEKIKILKHDKCSNLIEDDFVTTRLGEQVIQEYAICIFNNTSPELTVYSNKKTSEYKFIEYIIFPCSLDPSECVPVENLLKLVVFTPSMESLILLQNKNTPFQLRSGISAQVTVNPTLTIFSETPFQQHSIIDDDRDFLDPEVTHKQVVRGNEITSNKFRNFNIHCTPNQISSGQCEPYLVFRLSASPLETKYYRSYPKTIESIGIMGGFLQVTILIFEIIYFWYNWYFKRKYLIDQLIEYDSRMIHVIFSSDKFDKEDLKQLVGSVIYDIQDSTLMAQKVRFNLFLENLLLEKYHKVLIPFLAVDNMAKSNLQKNLHSKSLESGSKLSEFRRDLQIVYNSSVIPKWKKQNIFNDLLNDLILKQLDNNSLLERKTSKKTKDQFKRKTILNRRSKQKVKRPKLNIRKKLRKNYHFVESERNIQVKKTLSIEK